MKNILVKQRLTINIWLLETIRHLKVCIVAPRFKAPLVECLNDCVKRSLRCFEYLFVYSILIGSKYIELWEARCDGCFPGWPSFHGYLDKILQRYCQELQDVMLRFYQDRHVSKRSLTKKPRMVRKISYELLDFDIKAASKSIKLKNLLKNNLRFT